MDRQRQMQEAERHAQNRENANEQEHEEVWFSIFHKFANNTLLFFRKKQVLQWLNSRLGETKDEEWLGNRKNHFSLFR